MATHEHEERPHASGVEFAVVAHRVTETNFALTRRGWRGARSRLLSPRDALLALGPGDVALNRLDVTEELDGVEDGLWIVSQLEAQGVRVFNRPAALLAAHDKLITARLLRAAGIPHPRTRRLDATPPRDRFSFPAVAKPRFGSWGRDVELCADRRVLSDYVSQMEQRPWWRAGGVLQELVPPQASDLRVIVSAHDVVGAAVRVAAPGEWRTNVALGGRSVATTPTPEACELAVEATRALGIDLAGVDLLRDDGGLVVLEVNGAVDMKSHYSLSRDVFAVVLERLERVASGDPERPVPAG